MTIASKWHVEHWRDGILLSHRVHDNICPDEFINYMLDAGLSGGTPIMAWYIVLFSNNYTPLASETYASHGYTESTDYDETTRPAWSEAGVSSKVITNSASKATFTMGGTDTSIYGAALVSVSTKGDTAGGGKIGPVAQFSEGVVTGISDGDQLKIYVTITGSDA